MESAALWPVSTYTVPNLTYRGMPALPLRASSPAAHCLCYHGKRIKHVRRPLTATARTLCDGSLKDTAAGVPLSIAGTRAVVGLCARPACACVCAQVCAFKPHPIQLPWQQYAEEVLAPLSAEGVYACVPCESLEETRVSEAHPHACARIRMRMRMDGWTHGWMGTRERMGQRRARLYAALQHILASVPQKARAQLSVARTYCSGFVLSAHPPRV